MHFLLPAHADLSKSGRCGAGAGPLSLTERIINRFSQVGLAEAQCSMLVKALLG